MGSLQIIDLASPLQGITIKTDHTDKKFTV